MVQTAENKKELIETKQTLTREALDISILLEKIPENQREEVLDKALKKYADEENVSLLEIKARVLQYLPEYKNEVDLEVKKFFAKTSVVEMAFASEEKQDEFIRTFETLRDEGYLGYLTLAIHFSESRSKREKVFGNYDVFLKKTKKKFEEVDRKSTSEKIKMMMNKNAFLPEAKKQFEMLRNQPDSAETVNLFFRSWWFGKQIRQFWNEIYFSIDRELRGESFDCDEETLFNQKLGLLTETEIHEYVISEKHASLRINGYEIVLDTADNRFRTSNEFGRRAEYGSEFHKSYFYQTKEGFFLAEKDSDGKTEYKKVPPEENYPITKNRDICGLLHGEITNYERNGDVQRARKLCEFALRFDPNSAETNNDLAAFFCEEGNFPKAKKFFRRALEINPNSVKILENLGHLLSVRQGNEKRILELFRRALKMERRKNWINYLNQEIRELENKGF